MAESIKIAKVCHEANRAICETFGDTSQVPWEEAEEWQKVSAVKGVEFNIDNPGASPAETHESWLAEKVRTGWKYGEVKDPDAKTHPCMVPYSELPPEQRVKDAVFQAVVRTLTEEPSDQVCSDPWHDGNQEDGPTSHGCEKCSRIA